MKFGLLFTLFIASNLAFSITSPPLSVSITAIDTSTLLLGKWRFVSEKEDILIFDKPGQVLLSYGGLEFYPDGRINEFVPLHIRVFFEKRKISYHLEGSFIEFDILNSEGIKEKERYEILKLDARHLEIKKNENF